MDAMEYNRCIAGHVWSLRDLPPNWPGTAILAKADLDGDMDLEEGEKQIPNWKAFSDEVLKFQKANSLEPDGKLGPNTFEKLLSNFSQIDDPASIIGNFGPLSISRATRPTFPPETSKATGETPLEKRIATLWNCYGGAIQNAAKQFALPIEAALAVFSVESGKAYDPSTGLIIIRFEDETVWESKYGHGEISNSHKNQAVEWTALGEAASFDLDHAVMSASWGLPQIMGFNHDKIGYGNPLDMVKAFQDDVSKQVDGFFRFCQTIGIDDDIQQQDWDTVVRRYNGARPDHPKSWVRNIYNNYMAGLRNAYAAIKSMKQRGISFK